MKIWMVDNYDSFTYNLVHLICQLSHAEFIIKRNDAFSIAEVGSFNKIILSPGPGLPDEAGQMMELLNHYAGSKDILGICLGHHAIAQYYGATLHNLQEVVHGRQTKIIQTMPSYIFKNVEPEFEAGRYHSWIVNKETLPACLQIIAEDEQGNIMALQHVTHTVTGLQFHPESIMTAAGITLIQNWLSN